MARDEKLKELHDANIKRSTTVIPGSIVFWHRPALPDPTLNKKLQLPWIGPLICVHVDQSTAKLRHLHTGKYLKHRVSLTQLKCPNQYRQLPAKHAEMNANAALPKLTRIVSDSDPTIYLTPGVVTRVMPQFAPKRTVSDYMHEE